MVIEVFLLPPTACLLGYMWKIFTKLIVLFLISRDRRYNLDKPIYTSLMQFTIAILYDLDLDKSSSKDLGLVLEYDLKGVPRPS